ncbi:MAG: hypothetical protein ACJ75G_09415 [Gaiellaceae bacterium]
MSLAGLTEAERSDLDLPVVARRELAQAENAALLEVTFPLWPRP